MRRRFNLKSSPGIAQIRALVSLQKARMARGPLVNAAVTAVPPVKGKL